MTVHLAPQSEDFIKRKLESGEYQSATEVVNESLRLLDWRDRQREELRKELDLGVAQLENGEYTVYDDQSLQQLANEIKAQGRARLEARR